MAHNEPLQTAPHDPDDLLAFKQAFRRHAAGVAIVTSLDANGAPVGFTATSLASLAADPPLASFNMARTASTWPAIATGNRAVVHMLGSRNTGLAKRMARDHDQRFVGDHWYFGEEGLPILKDVTAWMSGRIIARTPVHNNVMVAIQIERGELGENDEPLLYHERAFRLLGEHA